MYIWEMFQDMREQIHTAIIAANSLLSERGIMSPYLISKGENVHHVILSYPGDGVIHKRNCKILVSLESANFHFFSDSSGAFLLIIVMSRLG